MKHKKLLLLGLLLVAAIFLVGCTTTPAPKTTATDAPVVTDAPAENPADTPVEEVTDSVGDAVEGAQETVEEVLEEVKETAEEVKEEVEGAVDEAKETAEEIKDAVEDALKPDPIYLSLEELKEFNGKDGKPAYVAVDGVIYDMTKSVPWKDGMHNGFEAGNDLTKNIKEDSPHGVINLERVPTIGFVKLELTLEQLKEFNGKDGKPAYVAVDGVIYDMTKSVPWKDGMHNGFEAGNDLTKNIKEDSPHGVINLERVPAIGIVVE
mgnify:FL=1